MFGEGQGARNVRMRSNLNFVQLHELQTSGKNQRAQDQDED